MLSFVLSPLVRPFLILIALSLGTMLSAQNFPVRASVTILEASPYLEDYGRDGNLLVVLTLVDNQPGYQGLLRITVQGNGYRAETRDLLAQPPIALNFGQPVILRGADLAPYFDLNNLSTEGIALDNTLGNGGALPDGPITICVEVYDVNRFSDPPVSNPACAVRFVQQHYPPELVNPLGEEMSQQVINFTWNPRHVPQPANDVYELDVWEKIPGLTVDQTINSAPPVTPTITTNIPRYVFTNYDGRLAADKTYIWRVRIRDLRNVRTFINDGYSQPGEFYFGEDPNAPDCPELATFYSTGTTANNAGLVWTLTDTAGINGYNLRYRVAGTEGWASTSLPGANLPTTTLAELSAGSNYEAELCATCIDGTTSCLKTTFTTPDQDSDCGPLPYPTVVPVSEDAITLSWEANEAAAGYRLYWSSIIAPPSLPEQETVPAGPRNRNRGQRISPVRRAPPGTSAPSPPNSPTIGTTDSLLLSAGTSSAEINGLVAGTDYRFRFCQLCPDGTQTCYEWTIDFNGVDDGCLTSLNFTRPDSTDTTLDLAWTYDPNDVSATDSFTIIWQLADGSGPELMATVAYEATSFTITDRIPGQTYTLRVCAECTIAEPTCRDLPPFGGCTSEYLPELVDIADKRALIGWPVDAPPALPTQARYAMRSFLNWTDLPTETFSYFNPEEHPFPRNQLAETPQLATQIVYLGQIRTQCHDTLWSAWSEPVEFSTGCSVVDPLEAVAITDESATILAVARANASYYQFYYRLQDTTENEWTLLDNIDAPAIELTNLFADTVYQVKMRYWCNLGVWSDFTDVHEFRTLPPCGVPEDAAATELFADAAGLSWLMGENALLTTLNYRQVVYSNQQTETQAEVPGGGGRNAGAGGRSSQSGGNSSNSTAGEWLVVENLADTTFLENLEGGARYEFRLQSDCDVNLSDWTVIDDFTLLCSPPSELSVSEITPFTALATIGGLSPTAGTHEYSYRLLGDSVWTAITRATSTTTLEDLNDLSTYELRVRTRCSAGQFSVWSDTLQFQTLVDCRVPTNLGVADMTTNSANIRWDITGTITRWEIRYYDPAAAVMQAQQQSFAPAGGGAAPGGGNAPAGGLVPNGTSGTLPSQNGGNNPSSGGGVSPSGGGVPATTSSTASGPAATDTPPPDPYANWQTISTTDPSRVFNGLVRNRKYKVVVRAECPTYGWTEFSEVLEFSPLCPQPVIDTATADSIGFEEVTLNWPALSPCLLQYHVELESLLPYPGISGPTSSSSGTNQGRGGPNPADDFFLNLPPTIYRDSATTTATSAPFAGLRPNTEYRFRVKGYFYKSEFKPGGNGFLTMDDGPFGVASGLWGANAGEDYVIGEPGWGDFSQWIVFRTDHCARPYDLVETTLSRSTMEISWTPSNGINEFEFKYKLAEDAGSSWAYETVTEPVIVLENLLTNAIYDYQVTEICQDGETFKPAPQDTFIMKKPSKIKDYVCGTCGDVDLSNREPLAELLRRDTFYAFDFPVYVTGVYGGNGVFSGEGEIRAPFFNKAKITFEFDNIEINSDYQMIGGFAEATGFGVEVLPPWADALLAGIIAGLEQWDASLEQQQVAQLDSLLLCCSEYMSDEMEQTFTDIVNCFDNADPPPSASYDACSQLMDAALLTMYDDLTDLADSVEVLKEESMALDLIRAALDELKEEYDPDIAAERAAYEATAAPFKAQYKVNETAGESPPIPSFLIASPRQLDCPPGSTINNVSLQAYQTSTDVIVLEGLVLTEHELYATLTDQIRMEPRDWIKEFAEKIRVPPVAGDLDVYASTLTAVQALENANEDLYTLLPEVKANVILKLKFLVNN